VGFFFFHFDSAFFWSFLCLSPPIRQKNLIVRQPHFVNIARLRPVDYSNDAMFNLTRQQQLFLCSVLLLLLIGWVVKAWRTSHPPERATISTVP